MSATLWAYNYSPDFYSGLRNVIEQGGDADTNGAVAGALLGLKFGLNSIPKYLIDNLCNFTGDKIVEPWKRN